MHYMDIGETLHFSDFPKARSNAIMKHLGAFGVVPPFLTPIQYPGNVHITSYISPDGQLLPIALSQVPKLFE